MEYDKEVQVKTISHTLGIDKTKWFSIGLLILYIVLSFMFYIYIPCDIKYQTFFRSFNLAIFTASLAGGLAAIFIVKSIKKEAKESVFTLELDGVIIAQSVFMIAIYSVYYFF
jgi:4-hydroxybenzoate polyprenyltransferase